MPNITGHAILKIVKGVQRATQDALSSEVGLDEVDLLDTNGFACDEYDIKNPALKSSAVYADSPLTDGRTLISGVLGNVSETIRLQITAGSLIQLAAILAKLGRFKQSCNDFWDTLVQIEPVYIKHQVDGEPGPRYALLYDIDIDVDTPLDPSVAQRTVTLVIEREHGWRGIAPGDNPKHWSYIVNGQSQQWTAANAHLLQGVDHLVVGTIQNRAEQNAGGSGYVTQNFIDIPANKIPGDLPALLNISVQQAVAVSVTALLMGKSTKPTTGNLSRFTGLNQQTVYNFNAGDGTAQTDTTLAADTGAPDNRAAANQRSQTTFVTATMVERLSWQNSTVPNGFSSAVFRGRFAVFARARVSAAATVELQLNVKTQGGDSVSTTPVTLTDVGAGGTGNSTDWAMVYLGYVTSPIDNKRTAVAPDGKGIWIDTAAVQNIGISIFASRSSGAGVLYISDLICIPMDEGMIEIAGSFVVGSGSTVLYSWHYDNTGYFMHGMTDDYATIDFVSTATPGHNMEADIPELTGSPIYLTPGVNNRLVFLSYVKSTKRSIFNDPSASTVRVNIVPRWSGLRDV